MLSLLLSAVLTTLTDINDACQTPYHGNIPFEVKGHVVDAMTSFSDNQTYLLSAEGKMLDIACTNGIKVASGSIVRVRGHVGLERNGWVRAYADAFDVLGHAPLPQPVDITSSQLSDPSFSGRILRLTATAIDLIPDDIDPRFERLILRDESGVFHVPLVKQPDGSNRALVGARLSLVGSSCVRRGGKRHFFTSALDLHDDGLTVLTPAPKDPFDVPDIAAVEFASVRTIYCMGRRKAAGAVLAAWGRRHMLIRTDAGLVMRADLANEAKLPPAGERVIVVGFPETDLFNINFARAIFKPIPGDIAPESTPQPIVATDILAGQFGPNEVQPQYHGRLVRICGKIAEQHAAALTFGTLELSCNGYRINVNVECCTDAIKAFEFGSTVEVTGVCVLNTRNWQPDNIFPRIDGVTVVLRTSRDIRLVNRPPWWTVGKLVAVIGGLFTALLAILIWNRFLHRVIRRRRNELVRMELAKAASDLRINERTRLAVDIHDSLSQTLAGVSFQIDAAEKTVGTDDAAARNFLTVARLTLASCREELRRCLWDLRNDAIGEPDFGKAVELVLQPHARAANIAVSFSVPRTALTDSTAHDVLSIIRELTVNAIRHGKAGHVRVEGAKHEGVIRFSVTDDGVGFDPARSPGVDEGHFGLLGVRERLNRLGGKFDIVSAPGAGTKVIVEIGK